MAANLPKVKSFFKVMMPGFQTRLLIPTALYELVDWSLHEVAILNTSQGSLRVSISKNENGKFYFTEGWNDFVNQHDLKVGDFAFFIHKGNMYFEVSLYDHTACEFTKKISDARRGETSNCVQRGKKRAETNGCGPAQFRTRLSSSNLRLVFPYLNVPTEFASEHGLSKSNETSLTVRDPLGKEWLVWLRTQEVSATRKRISLARGWDDIVVHHKLKVGDLCVFKFKDSKKKILNLEFPEREIVL